MERLGLGRLLVRMALVPLACGTIAQANTPTDIQGGSRAALVSEQDPSATVVEIEVRRNKPKKDKKPSLRFLKENLSFLRSRIDGLESRNRERDVDGAAIDPRWLAYLEMEKDLTAADSHLVVLDASLDLAELLESIAELGRVEAELASLETLLAEESARLDRIQEDFIGRQRTTLVVLLQGEQSAETPQGMTLVREDGTEIRVTIGRELQVSLDQGAVAQADHDFVEPRDQWMGLSLPSRAELPAQTGYVEFTPVRNQINFLEFDLASMASSSVEDWEARFWSRPHQDVTGGVQATW